VKRILILTVLAGIGHLRAAEAIAKGIQELNTDVEVKTCDPIGITTPKLQQFFNNSYLLLANNTPYLWGWIYNSRILSSYYSPFRWYVKQRYAKSIKFIIDEFKPDIVVSTHPFTAEGTGEIKRRKFTNIPLVSVATDYHVHPFGINNYVDMFIVPSFEVASYLRNRGVQNEKIRISGGLPTDPKFFKPQDKNQLGKKLGIQEEHKVVLVLCGGFGMGMGDVSRLLRNFIDIDFPLQLLIVVGKNEVLKNKLTQISNQLKIKTKIFGFVENMEELMTVCDIVVTKPGGMSIAEALTKGLPIILTKPVPGQEKWNIEMLLKEKVALQPKNLAEIPALITKLFTQEKKRLEEMQQRIYEKFAQTKAIYNLANLLLEVVNK